MDFIIDKMIPEDWIYVFHSGITWFRKNIIQISGELLAVYTNTANKGAHLLEIECFRFGLSSSRINPIIID